MKRGMTQAYHKIDLLKTHWKYWHDFFDFMFKYDWDYQVMRKEHFSFALSHPHKYTMKEETCDCCHTPIKVSFLERFSDRQIKLCPNCYVNYKKYLKGN